MAGDYEDLVEANVLLNAYQEQLAKIREAFEVFSAKRVPGAPEERIAYGVLGGAIESKEADDLARARGY